MPRYFFHLRDHYFTPDDTGQELADIEAARRETLRICSGVLRDSLDGPPDSVVLAVVCTDKADEVVSAITVSRPSRADARETLSKWRSAARD